MAHQVFVGITENIVAFSPVPGKIKCRVFENSDEVGKRIDLILTAAELGVVVEVRHVGELVGTCQRPEDLFIDLVANIGFTFEGNHLPEACSFRNSNGGITNTCVFVADILHKEQNENIVFVLAGIHATAKFIAALPERGIKFGFLESHTSINNGTYTTDRTNGTDMFLVTLAEPCSISLLYFTFLHWTGRIRVNIIKEITICTF